MDKIQKKGKDKRKFTMVDQKVHNGRPESSVSPIGSERKQEVHNVWVRKFTQMGGQEVQFLF